MVKQKGKILSMEQARRRSGSRRSNPLPEDVRDMYRTQSRHKSEKPVTGADKTKKAKRNYRRRTESLNEYKRGMAISRSTTAVAGLFFVFVLVYLVRSMFVFFTTPNIPVDMIRLGSFNTPAVIEGIIIRDEITYTAPADGLLQFSVNHYDRVRPGSEVASIQNIDAVNNIRRSIYHVEEQIIRLQDLRGDLSPVDPSIHQINNRIKNLVDNRLNRHIDLDMAEVFSLRDGIVQNMNIRNQMIVAENIMADVRPELGIQYNVLLGELDANRIPIRINGGGIVVPSVDGLEYLNFYNMLTLTREQTRQNVDVRPVLSRREVSYGDDIFKIINSNRWYIGAYVPNDLINGMEVRDNVMLHIEGRRDPVRVQVHHIETGFTDSFVLFMSAAYLAEFINKRSIMFSTTDTVEYGFRIASTALTEQADENGTVQTGVYKVINGIAAFVPVVLPDDVPAGSVYIMLSQTQNPNLREHDHIVSDASLVQDGDIVLSRVR